VALKSLFHLDFVWTAQRITFPISNLFVDGREKAAGLVVETLFAGIVANVPDGFSDNLLVIYFRFGRDLSTDHHHTRFCHCFAGDTGVRVLLQTGVQDGVRYLEDMKLHYSEHQLKKGATMLSSI
jgi:hypothetical protein